MTKQFALGFLFLCLLLPVGAMGRARGVVPSEESISQIIKSPSTTLEWKGSEEEAYFHDLDSEENAAILQRMITIPESFSIEEQDIVIGSDVEAKRELARKKLQEGSLPEEWFQLGYIAGLAKYFDRSAERAQKLDLLQSSFIRFMQLYVLNCYLNDHVEYRRQAHYKNINKYLVKINEHSLANVPVEERKTAIRKDPNTHFTQFLDDVPTGDEGTGSITEETVQRAPVAGREGGSGLSIGTGGEGGNGGDPNGVPGGWEGSPRNSCAYDGRYVYVNTRDIDPFKACFL